MDKEKLRAIAEYIAEYPTAYDQDHWFCGTTACIAGHACYLDGYVRYDNSSRVVHSIRDKGKVFVCPPTAADQAKAILGLTADQADRLFSAGCYWPHPFSSDYMKAKERKDHQKMACVAAARIKHFIETDGRE